MSSLTSSRYEANSAELDTLREIVEAHAPIERLAGSTGEYRSAQLLTDQLKAAGAENSRIEPATFLQGWASALAIAVSLPLVAGIIAPKRGRTLLGLASIVAGALVADDIDNRPRFLRRALRRQRATTNVVAELGEADAPITLVVMAHHDAARTGWMFDQGGQIFLHKHFPKRIEAIHTSPPWWWPAFAAPIAVGLGLLTGRRWLQLGGAALCAGAFTLLTNIARSPVVPGANDNLSAVAVLVALAERLREHPVDGVRVVLLSAGAEEELQGGVYSYLERHADELDPATTYCLAVDTVGSPSLVMLEGEGPVKMHDYAGPEFRDLTQQVAAERGVQLERGMRSRFSTDGIVFSRAKIPTVALVSLAAHRAPSNYHLMTDTPENLDYDTIASTVELCEGVARRLGSKA
jgi:hypothetical protein